MPALLEELQQVLSEEGHPVTSRWLCYQHGVGADTAQRALKACVEKSPDTVAVTYLLSGTLPCECCRVLALPAMPLFGRCWHLMCTEAHPATLRLHAAHRA
jgi:hypothetical protein